MARNSAKKDQEAPVSTTTTTDPTGEVAVDKDATAQHLKEQTAEDRIEQAKREGVANHVREHARDEGDVTSRDKTED